MFKGWQKTSFIDYPGKISTVLFVSGCNFRCGFCHNPELVYNRRQLKIIKSQEIINFLNKRKKVIEAAVISGGEPTIYKNLPNLIKQLKDQGLFIKLDTNGTNPEMLDKLINSKLIDYLAMDIKAAPKKYQLIVNRAINIDKIKNSIKLIINGGLPYEFRSTILPALHSEEDILEMAKFIKGAEFYYLQKFVSRNDLVNRGLIKEKSYSQKEMAILAKKCEQFVKKCLVR